MFNYDILCPILGKKKGSHMKSLITTTWVINKSQGSVDQRERPIAMRGTHSAECNATLHSSDAVMRDYNWSSAPSAFHLVNYSCTRTHTLAPDSVCNFRVSGAQNHVASVELCTTATMTAGNEARSLDQRNMCNLTRVLVQTAQQWRVKRGANI